MNDCTELATSSCVLRILYNIRKHMYSIGMYYIITTFKRDSSDLFYGKAATYEFYERNSFSTFFITKCYIHARHIQRLFRTRRKIRDNTSPCVSSSFNRNLHGEKICCCLSFFLVRERHDLSNFTVYRYYFCFDI